MINICKINVFMQLTLLQLYVNLTTYTLNIRFAYLRNININKN